MYEKISISRARAHIAELVEQVYEKGRVYQITKNNTPLALIIDIERGESLIKPDNGLLKKKLAAQTRNLQKQSKKLDSSTAELLKQARQIKETLYE
jgi:prevent-host-death family protein